MTALESHYVVACLCAEWCGTCRGYRDVFMSLAAEFPQACFHWIDIEEQSHLVDDLELEDFPTLFVYGAEQVLFYGVLMPHEGHLRRVLSALFQIDSRAIAEVENRAALHHLGRLLSVSSLENQS